LSRPDSGDPRARARGRLPLDASPLSSVDERPYELVEDARASKQALEACIGGPIRGFIPPFNRPSHFPQKGAFSFSEQLGLQGRGRGRQSVASLFSTLGDLGFGWCRISYQNSFENLGVKLGFRSRSAPCSRFYSAAWSPCHCTPPALARRLARTIPNDESAGLLDRFLASFEKERRAGKLHFETMAEVERATRSPG
jgi:hypothetical protein